MTRHIIPLAVARCPADSRLHHCSKAPGCARHIAGPDQGRPQGDYSASINTWTPEKCEGFLDATGYLAGPSVPPAPRVHPAW